MLSRRDQFAAAALTGILARGAYNISSYEHVYTELAVKYADKLIEELDKIDGTEEEEE